MQCLNCNVVCTGLDQVHHGPGLQVFKMFLSDLPVEPNWTEPFPCLGQSWHVDSLYNPTLWLPWLWQGCSHNSDMLTCITQTSSLPIIPPVRMNLAWGSGQYSLIQQFGGTGPSLCLTAWACIGLIWSSPCTLAILTLFLSQVPLKIQLIIIFITAYLWIPTLGEYLTFQSEYLMSSRYILSNQRLIEWTNTWDLDTVSDWSWSVLAGSVHVPTKWELVWSRCKNYSDWIGLNSDGSSLD
jgi:hypothetical protein